MDEKFVSLCVSYPSWGDPERQMLFRIADYDVENDVMYQVAFDNTDYEDEVKRIGFHPKDSYPFMAELREWEYAEDDSNKTWSYLYSRDIYEIVFLPELVGVGYNDNSTIRSVLSSGFTLDESVSERLLVVVGKHGSHYAVLQCRKKDLKRLNGNLYLLSSDVRDMMHAMHYLKEYDIVESQIISTDNQYISLNSGRAATRYFYNSTTLPEQEGVFHLVDFSKYIPHFVTSYLKKNKVIAQFNSSDIRKITELLEVIFSDKKHQEDFFACTGFSSEKLQELLPQYKEVLSELLLNDSEAETVIKHSLLEDENIWSRCIEIVRAEWLAEQDEEKKLILDKIESLKSEESMLSVAINESKKKKHDLDEELLLLTEQLDSQKGELAKIKLDIETELADFSDNIVHTTAVCAVAQKFSSGTEKVLDNSADIIVITPATEKKNDDIEDYDDFQEALADNLMLIGYQEDAVDAMSQLITYSMSSYMPILLSGNGDNIAQCIAAMFGSSVVILNICNNNKPQDYLQALQGVAVGNSVILVNGAFAGITIEHFNAIKYHFSEKGYSVLFTLDGVDVDMLPKSIFEKAMFLDCHQNISYYSPQNLNGYSVNLSSLSTYYSADDIDAQLKKLAPFITSGIINQLVAINYAKFMAEIDCNIYKDWLVLLQICVFAKATNKTEILVKVLGELGVEFKELKYYL